MNNDELMDKYLNALHELNHEKLRREAFERDLRTQQGIVDSFAKNVLNIGYEARDLAAELKRTKEKLAQAEATIGAQLVELDDIRAEVTRLRSASFTTAVPAEEYDRLKAEVERLSAELSNITGWGRGLESDLCRARAELMLEKAEVERLEKEVWRMKVFKGIDEDTKATLKDALNTVPEWAKVMETIENNARLETENINLKAEVERLTKAAPTYAVPPCIDKYEAK